MDEEILTGLRNAIEQGESLQEAIQIMINSGYSAKEVYEASKFIGGGILESHQSKPDEQFVFPEKKSFFQNLLFKRKSKDASFSSSGSPASPASSVSSMGQIPEPTMIKGQFSKELDSIKPKENYTKEIFLVVTLLVLVGILILTIIFKSTILGWFS